MQIAARSLQITALMEVNVMGICNSCANHDLHSDLHLANHDLQSANHPKAPLRRVMCSQTTPKMDPQKAPQALRWLEDSALKSQSPKMGFQKALQALRWLESNTLKRQSPKMGFQKAPQALRWLENSILKTKVQTESGTNKVAISPHGLILNEDETKRCRMPLDALLTPFSIVLHRF